jgi:hypothetical protein
MSPSRCDQDPADRRQQFAVPGRAQAPRDPIAMGTSRSTTIQQFLEGERPRELYALSRRICGCHPSSVGEKRLWVKNLFIFVLLVLAAWFGWKYFNPPVPVQIAQEPVAVAEHMEIPFHLRLKVQKLILKFEPVLLVRNSGHPVPARTQADFSRDFAGIQRDLQRLKIYDTETLRQFCLQACSEIDTNGDRKPDYSREQGQLLVDGMLGLVGLR